MMTDNENSDNESTNEENQQGTGDTDETQQQTDEQGSSDANQTNSADDGSSDAATSGDQGASWFASIEDKSLQNVAKRYASPTDLVKAHHQLRNEFTKAVKVPSKGAKDEEIAAYKKAIGVPEAPDGYEFPNPSDGTELTDIDKEFRAGWAQTFHKYSLSKEQAKGLAAEFVSFSEAQNEKAIKEDEQYQAQNEAALRKEWGEDYTRNQNAAKVALSRFGQEDVEDLMGIETKSGRLLLDHPQMQKFLARVGLNMVGDEVGDPAMSPTDKASAQERIDEIMELMYKDPKEYERRQPELRELNVRLHGTAAA